MLSEGAGEMSAHDGGSEVFVGDGARLVYGTLQEWGRNVVGLLLDDSTDWKELRELLTDSYCLQAPHHLAELVQRPPRHRSPTGKHHVRLR